MKIELSHSAVSRYQRCPKDYEYHYKKGYRPKLQSAALLFGTAVDRGISTLLKGDKDPNETFLKSWRFQDINGKGTYLPKCGNIVYSDSDFDYDLLDKEQKELIEKELDIEDIKKELSTLLSHKRTFGFEKLNYKLRERLNFIYWQSLKTKGLLMIEGVREKIQPKIKELIALQKYVKLESEAGLKVKGYADAIIRYEGYDKPIIIDFKTSSREYDQDSVLVSPQLSLYVDGLSSEYENTNLAGFIVLNKNVIKNKKKTCNKCGVKAKKGSRHDDCYQTDDKGDRCHGEWDVEIDPEIDIQVLINEIPNKTREIVLENIEQIGESIETNRFTRNFQSCKMPWGKCTFYNICYFDSKDGIIDTKEVKEEEL